MSQQAAERHDHPHTPTPGPLGGDACCGAGGADGSVGRHTYRHVFKVQGLDCADVVRGAARVTKWA